MTPDSQTALVVAAHPDDEVLGCGGTLAKLQSLGWETHVLILAEGITSRDDIRDSDLREAELMQLRQSVASAHETLQTTTVTTADLPDNRMDSLDLLDVVKLVEARIAETGATRIYTHHSGDVNIDHRITHEAVQAAARPQPGSRVKELYYFEIPSSTEWRASGGSGHFMPTIFIDIAGQLDTKQAALSCYEGEMRDWPHSRSHEAVSALARWRGATVGCDAAEAFVVGRVIA